MTRHKEFSSQVTETLKLPVSGDVEPRDRLIPKEVTLDRIRLLLEHLEPDSGYDDWLKVLMAVFYESDGDEEGCEIVNKWSSKGEKYQGSEEILAKWRSFDLNRPNHYGFSTLMDMVEEAGFDALEILDQLEPQFEVCEYVIVNASSNIIPGDTKEEAGPLEKYSLRGHSEKIKKNLVEQVPVIGKMALKGQATVFYAPPNTGKTLITLKELIDSVQAGRVNPNKLFYINVDDGSQGLLQKNKYAEKYDFHMISEGYRDFQPKDIELILEEYIENDIASDVIIILDTAKAFVDVMDKTRGSSFNRTARQFVLKGGTFILLAHTNKNPNASGQLVPGGTSDIKDDFDCAYVISPGSISSDNRKQVVFDNIKRRGSVVKQATYSYSVEDGLSYEELFDSVRIEEGGEVNKASSEEAKVDQELELVVIVSACIKEGITGKMDLVKELRERGSLSKNKATQFIEKYTGDDPKQHKWNFKTVGHGKQEFYLVEKSGEEGE